MSSPVSSSAEGWRKSSFSLANGECIEMRALSDGTIGVRDSKDPEGGILRFSRGEIDAFLRGAQVGEFDDLR